MSFGVSLCVRAAARALADGGAAREALRAIERSAPTLQNGFVAGGAPGGRGPREAGLHLLSFRDGRAETLGAAGSLEHAAELIAARVLAHEGPIEVAIGHADNATAIAADALSATLAGSGRVIDVLRYRVGPSIGAHTGPLTYGAFWWPAAALPW